MAVIGAGITGITTAYSLAKRGFKVTVIDKEQFPAMQTSYANGGQLSVSNSDVWTTWSNVTKGAKWIFQKDAPLLIRPLPTYSKIKWLTKFMYNTAMGYAEQNTTETIKMGLAAREVYLQIAEDENIEFDLTKKGILHFYRNEKYFEDAKRSTELYNKLGVERRIVDSDELRVIEPSLISYNYLGGTYTPSDMNGDIHKFCRNLAQVLESKYQVNFMHELTVSDNLETIMSMFSHTVLCAGVYSKQLAEQLGEKLDIYPVKGYSITVDLDKRIDEFNLAPHVSLLDDETKIVSSRLGNRLRVAGTAELNGYNYDIRQDRIDPLKRWVRQNFPGVSLEHVVPWAGLRPMTPNMMPIVKQSSIPNLWFNTGHGHLGWTLGAATAEIVAENILNSRK